MSVQQPDMSQRFEISAALAAPPDEVFAHVDDPLHLAAHMAKPSWAMAGGQMQLRLDEGAGRKPGSHIRMGGRVLGLRLALDEVIVERHPPLRKVWETVGAPNLLVIGSYRMGFDIAPQGSGSLLRVFIEYALAEGFSGRWLGRLFGRIYARWCSERMASDAARHFQAHGKEKR
jgi:hypothetical protein